MAWEARVTACNRQTATRERRGHPKRGLTRKKKRRDMLTKSERERARRAGEASVDGCGATCPTCLKFTVPGAGVVEVRLVPSVVLVVLEIRGVEVALDFWYERRLDLHFEKILHVESLEETM